MNKADILKRLNKRIEDTIDTIAIIEAMDDDAEPEGTFAVDSMYVSMNIEWGVDNLAKARKLLGPQWERVSIYKADDGSRTYSYSHKENRSAGAYINMRPMQNTTCKRVLVGHKEVPIYEIVCDEIPTHAILESEEEITE